MESKADEVKTQLKEAMAKKDALEEEIIALQATIPKDVGPLVDREGFPRSDVDVWTIRTNQHKVACLQTDHKAIMAQIEELMVRLHASVDTPDPKRELLPKKAPVYKEEDAFCRIDDVLRGSPAESAGLEIGDLVVTFGSVNKANYSDATIVGVVRENIGRKVPLTIFRSSELRTVHLTPNPWSGTGYLGCKIGPIRRPS